MRDKVSVLLRESDCSRTLTRNTYKEKRSLDTLKRAHFFKIKKAVELKESAVAYMKMRSYRVFKTDKE